MLRIRWRMEHFHLISICFLRQPEKMLLKLYISFKQTDLQANEYPQQLVIKQHLRMAFQN